MEQFQRTVAAGRLKPEDPVPGVRQLALDLTINPNTVARAYLELEHQGFLYKRPGQGTYVCAQAPGAARREQTRMVADLKEKAIGMAVSSGMSTPEIDALYHKLMQQYALEAV